MRARTSPRVDVVDAQHSALAVGNLGVVGLAGVTGQVATLIESTQDVHTGLGSESIDDVTLRQFVAVVADWRPATLPYAADIEGVKTLIAQMEARQTKWLPGIMAAASVSVAVAVIRTSVG